MNKFNPVLEKNGESVLIFSVRRGKINHLKLMLVPGVKMNNLLYGQLLSQNLELFQNFYRSV